MPDRAQAVRATGASRFCCREEEAGKNYVRQFIESTGTTRFLLAATATGKVDMATGDIYRWPIIDRFCHFAYLYG